MANNGRLTVAISSACLLSALVLPAAIASSGAARDEAGSEAVRSSGPATETFHIAPGQPPYTTTMEFDPDRSYEVEVSGTIKETVYDRYNSDLIVDELTLSAYHCLAARHQCAYPDGRQNFLVRNEDGLDPSFPVSGPYPAFSPNGVYRFTTPGFDNQRLTFKPIPDGLYGPPQGDHGDAAKVTYSGEGFNFKITELPNSCPAPGAAGEPSRGRPVGGCDERVKFRFSIHGFPDKPDKKELPANLVDTLVSGEGYLEPSTTSDEYSAHGEILILTLYERASGKIVRKHITLLLRDDPTPSYVTKPNQPNYGKLLFGGRVHGDDTNEPDCRDSSFDAGFAIDGQRAAFKLVFDQHCLSGQPIGWRPKHFKQASIVEP